MNSNESAKPAPAVATSSASATAEVAPESSSSSALTPSAPAVDRQQVQGLIAKWRTKGNAEMEEALSRGRVPAAVVAAMRLECADELSALLSGVSDAEKNSRVDELEREVALLNAALSEFNPQDVAEALTAARQAVPAVESVAGTGQG